MTLNRSVVGRKPRFTVTRRATPGLQQVSVPTPTPTPSPTGSYVPPVQTAAVPTVQTMTDPVQNRYSTDFAMGYGELAGGPAPYVPPGQGLANAAAASDDPLQRWLGGLFGGNPEGPGLDTSINPSGPSTPPTGYQTGGDRFATGAAGLDDPLQRWLGSLVGDESGQGYQPTNTAGEGSGSSAWEFSGTLTPFDYAKRKITSNDTSADDRMAARILQQVEQGVGGQGAAAYEPDPGEIKQAVDNTLADFYATQAQLEAKKAEALRDGEAEVADSFNAQITDLRDAIQRMEDEIAVTRDIEGWYRRRIAGPYERAKKAAEEINFQKTLDIKQRHMADEAKMMADMDARMNDVLTELGFTPEGIAAMNAEEGGPDAAVLAAGTDLLGAMGVREGELSYEKQLKYWMAEEELQRSNKDSAGRELVTTSRLGDQIEDAEKDIGDLAKRRDDSIARMKRAVERNFQGAEFPSREDVTAAAMDDMLAQLTGDMSPAEQDMYRELVGAYINYGLGEVNHESLAQGMLDGQIPIGRDEIAARAEAAMEVLDRELTDQELYDIAYGVAREAFDYEDIGILGGLTDTYEAANRQYDQWMDKRSTGTLSGATNRDPANVADARAGVGVYGARRHLTQSMATAMTDMWGTGNGGRVRRIDTGFRTGDAGPGQAENSDHYTGGAADVFLDANNPQDMAYFQNVMRPQLDAWVRDGIIANYIPLGGNAYHMDHVHISYALNGMSDQQFNPLGDPDHSHVDTGTTTLSPDRLEDWRAQ